MPHLYQTKIWQARLPEGWKVRELLFDGATFFKPDGIGQIFVMVCRPESERPKFNPAFHKQFSGKLQGIATTSTGSGAFHRFWWLFCGSRTIVVNYSCAASFAEDERLEVDDILQSVAESDAPAAE
jgi:hypothetical protein